MGPEPSLGGDPCPNPKPDKSKSSCSDVESSLAKPEGRIGKGSRLMAEKKRKRAIPMIASLNKVCIMIPIDPTTMSLRNAKMSEVLMSTSSERVSNTVLTYEQNRLYTKGFHQLQYLHNISCLLEPLP